MPAELLSRARHALFRYLAWIPVIASFLLLVVLVPFLLLNNLVCLDNAAGLPLFAAYLGLFGFPLLVFLLNCFFSKRISVSFEQKHKEIFLAFWIWLVLMLWMVESFLLVAISPLPGFQTFFVCAS